MNIDCPDRPPDLDLESMNVWGLPMEGEVPSQEDLNKKGIFKFSSEEPLNEIRYYSLGDTLVLIFSRYVAGGEIVAAVKMKAHGVGSSFLSFPDPMTKEEYLGFVEDSEKDLFLLGFQLTNVVDKVQIEAAGNKVIHPG
jgi:hypothetical protein